MRYGGAPFDEEHDVKLFAKSPTEMRREAEALGKPKRRLPKQGAVDPAKALLSYAEGRPLLDGANFAAYLRTGRFTP
jgi:hypothetical protein